MKTFVYKQALQRISTLANQLIDKSFIFKLTHLQISKLAFITATQLLLITSVFAQAPQKMSYQAVIRDASSMLVANQLIGMQISILQGTAAGTAVYIEIQTPTSNANGLVSLEIGAGSVVSGTFATIDWANDSYFIKTETDPTGGTNYTIIGTSQLLSVPYALFATSSGNSGWSLSGNASTNPTNNFVGTTDNQPLIFRVNDVQVGKLSNDSNAFYGTQSGLNNTSGSNNTGNGFFALSSNTNGNSNTANGVNTLRSNTSGNSNTANGSDALRSNINGSGNTANGGRALELNTTGFENSATGFRALANNTTGNFNTAIGSLALFNIITSSNNIGIGNNAQVPNSAANNQVRIGNTQITSASIQVAWTITSDKRFKNTIKDTDLGLNFVNRLRPVSYFRNKDESHKREYGFVAQELQETLNQLGVTDSGIISKDFNGMLSVRYNDLFAPLVKAIQELILQNEALKAENSTNQSKIESLVSRLENLERKLNQ